MEIYKFLATVDVSSKSCSCTYNLLPIIIISPKAILPTYPQSCSRILAMVPLSYLISENKKKCNRFQRLFLTLLKISKEEKLTKKSGGAIGLEYNRRRGDCEKGVSPRDTSLTN